MSVTRPGVRPGGGGGYKGEGVRQNPLMDKLIK